MKYTRSQFDATSKCFDETIKNAKEAGKPVHFACWEYGGAKCPYHCPMRRRDSTVQCLQKNTADRWQSLKEQFIIENEPED